jgi:hypothetical protein
MNIHTSYPLSQPSRSAGIASVAERRQDLEKTIDEQREAIQDQYWDGDLTPEEAYHKDSALDRLDPRVAEAKVKGWKTATRSLVGAVAGALTGFQGGNTALYGIGVPTLAAITRGIQQSGEGVGEGLLTGAFYSPIVGLLSSVGGPFGAAVGGITGAVIAGNLPGLLQSAD